MEAFRCAPRGANSVGTLLVYPKRCPFCRAGNHWTRMADRGSTLSGNAAAFVPNAAAPPVLTPLTPPPVPATTKGRGRGRERGRGRGRDGRGAARGNRGRGRGRGRGRSVGKGRGGRAPSAAEATLVEMGYAPAAARRALEATGSVEAAISALDPGYCAAVDTQQARGNANHLLRFTTERPQQQPPPRRRAPASRGARTGPGVTLRGARDTLLVAAGVASPFACDADEAPPWDSVIAADVVADAIRCPICLEDEARAPVVTRCGHGFCAACVVRHCTSDYVRSRKCPCCAAPLSVKDLRPAFLREPAADLVLLERPKSGRRACLADRVSERLPSTDDRCDLLSKITEATPAAASRATKLREARRTRPEADDDNERAPSRRPRVFGRRTGVESRAGAGSSGGGGQDVPFTGGGTEVCLPAPLHLKLA